MRASPSRSTPSWCCGWRASTKCSITVEEGAIGGFGSYVLQTLAEHGGWTAGSRCARMVLPDVFIDQDSPAAMYAKAGLDAQGIVAKVFEALGKDIRRDVMRRLRRARRMPAWACHEAMIDSNDLGQPRGFCAGVVRAIEIVERALEKYGPPVYVRHEIVHNKHVVESLKAKGAIFVEELSEVPPDAVTDLQRPWRRQERRGRGRRARNCRCSTRPVRW